jgi:RimJ/RimL family protein N-acetyltransferase
MPVSLRPQIADDLSSLTGGDSAFDEFGPQPQREKPAPPLLLEPGALSIILDNGKLVGYVSWHWRVWGPTRDSHCPMIGIWLTQERRGEGIGREAQRLIVELFFRHTNCNRVEAHTDVDNIAEQKALEAAGFTREATIREAQWRDGRFRDMYLYSVLRSECDLTAAAGR